MIKRSVAIRGHRTSVSLEEPFWRALREMAAARGVSVAAVIRDIDDERSRQMTLRSGGGESGEAAAGGLSSAIRIAVLEAARSGALETNPAPKAGSDEPG